MSSVGLGQGRGNGRLIGLGYWVHNTCVFSLDY